MNRVYDTPIQSFVRAGRLCHFHSSLCRHESISTVQPAMFPTNKNVRVGLFVIGVLIDIVKIYSFPCGFGESFSLHTCHRPDLQLPKQRHWYHSSQRTTIFRPVIRQSQSEESTGTFYQTLFRDAFRLQQDSRNSLARPAMKRIPEIAMCPRTNAFLDVSVHSCAASQSLVGLSRSRDKVQEITI